MATALKWMNRPAMLKRGKRIIRAHWWSKTADLEDRIGIDAILEIWFDRNVHKYAATQWGVNVKPTDQRRMAKRFWYDVIDQLEIEYEIKET